MPSRLSAVALIGVVLLAGCSTVPGVGEERTPEPVDYHELVFASFADGEPFEANVTVTKDGERVYQRDISADGDGTYLNLTTFGGPGPYTVHVNTTISELGGGTEQDTFEIAGRSGNATVVHVDVLGVEHDRIAVPRRSLERSVSVHQDYMDGVTEKSLDVDVRLRYRGEQVAERSVTQKPDETLEVDLERAGLYRVDVRGKAGWTRKLVVVGEGQHVQVNINTDGKVNRIRVKEF